jgi:hypothetical protein
MTVEQTAANTVEPRGANGLPQIVNYDSTSDLPAAYNQLSVATDAALDLRLKKSDPSVPVTSVGYRRIHVGATAPSGALAGDVWLQT